MLRRGSGIQWRNIDRDWQWRVSLHSSRWWQFFHQQHCLINRWAVSRKQHLLHEQVYSWYPRSKNWLQFVGKLAWWAMRRLEVSTIKSCHSIGHHQWRTNYWRNLCWFPSTWMAESIRFSCSSVTKNYLQLWRCYKHQRDTFWRSKPTDYTKWYLGRDKVPRRKSTILLHCARWNRVGWQQHHWVPWC